MRLEVEKKSLVQKLPRRGDGGRRERRQGSHDRAHRRQGSHTRAHLAAGSHDVIPSCSTTLSGISMESAMAGVVVSHEKCGWKVFFPLTFVRFIS